MKLFVKLETQNSRLEMEENKEVLKEIQSAFKKATLPNFGLERDRSKDARGCYVDPVLEDHWNTFQEGWVEAVNFMKKKGVL